LAIEFCRGLRELISAFFSG